MLYTVSKEKQEYWTKMGLMYGYPMCCIEEFLIVEIPRPVRKFSGTGYIPCAKCNEKTEQVMIDEIEKNRTWHKPFPFGKD
jgi:hypothetical protein